MKYYFVLFLIFLLLPFPLNASLTGGDFEIYADSFSVVQDQLTTSGGNYALYNTAGEPAGIVGTSATGTISSTLNGFGYGFAGVGFTLSDGLTVTSFTFRNRAGSQTGTIEAGTVTIDTGGAGAMLVGTMTDRIAQAINSVNANIEIQATSDGVDTVSLVNTRTAESDGNVPITETVVDPAFVVTGMSGGGGTGFVLRGGFQAMERASLSMNIDSNTLSLGTLSLSEVKSGAVTMNVTTDSSSGYSVSVSEDGNLRKGSGGDIDDINDVSDGSVSVGSEEYGISTTGIAGLLIVDTAVEGVLPIIQSASSVENQMTTVTFRASIGNMSRAGSYSHIVTFSATANP